MLQEKTGLKHEQHGSQCATGAALYALRASDDSAGNVWWSSVKLSILKAAWSAVRSWKLLAGWEVVDSALVVQAGMALEVQEEASRVSVNLTARKMLMMGWTWARQLCHDTR